ncbi:MAG TPA: hypothetical protein VGJ44_20540 [Kribbellaceae bacterium]
MGGRELLHDGDDVGRQRAGVRPDPEQAAGLGVAAERGPRRLDGGQDLLGVPDKPSTRGGEPHVAAGPLDQLDAQVALQGGQLRGDGRGPVSGRLGHRAHRAPPVQLDQGAEQAGLHGSHRPRVMDDMSTSLWWTRMVWPGGMGA